MAKKKRKKKAEVNALKQVTPVVDIKSIEPIQTSIEKNISLSRTIILGEILATPVSQKRRLKRR